MMSSSKNGLESTFFTSESVTEGHPDKLCDQISDAVLDAVLTDDPYSRVACEAAATTGLVMVFGEITTSTYVEIPELVRNVIRDIGYTDSSHGFDSATCGVMVSLKAQSWRSPVVLDPRWKCATNPMLARSTTRSARATRA